MCFAIPGRIESVHFEGAAPFATVDFAGQPRKVALAFLPDLVPGDWVIVHAGFALTRLTEAQAAEVIATMQEADLLTDSPAPPAQVLATAEPMAYRTAAMRPPTPSSPARPAWRGGPQLGNPPSPGPTRPDPSCTDEVCLTCSDEGRPGDIIELPPDLLAPALVRTERGLEEVDVTLVRPVQVGDRILIHAGSAITRLDLAQEAQ